jgi:hypothetical protein
MINRIMDTRLNAIVMDVAILGTISTRRDEVITGLTQSVSTMNTRLDTAMTQADSLRTALTQMAQRADQQHAQLVALIMHQNQGSQGGGGLPGGTQQHHG